MEVPGKHGCPVDRPQGIEIAAIVGCRSAGRRGGEFLGEIAAANGEAMALAVSFPVEAGTERE